jgi:ABC-type phosphate transport system auxiliary subunit
MESRIKDLKKQARLASNLPEKLKLEKERRQIEVKRDTAWRAYEQESKVIENRKDSLIDEIEKKLKPEINDETIFMIRWEVV